MDKLPGNVVSMSGWLEREAAPTPEDITRRLAEIALQMLTLQSEKNRLDHHLAILRINAQE